MTFENVNTSFIAPNEKIKQFYETAFICITLITNMEVKIIVAFKREGLKPI